MQRVTRQYELLRITYRANYTTFMYDNLPTIIAEETEVKNRKNNFIPW